MGAKRPLRLVQYNLGPERLTRLGKLNVLRMPVSVKGVKCTVVNWEYPRSTKVPFKSSHEIRLTIPLMKHCTPNSIIFRPQILNCFYLQANLEKFIKPLLWKRFRIGFFLGNNLSPFCPFFIQLKTIYI